jgi:hypothetical protein
MTTVIAPSLYFSFQLLDQTHPGMVNVVLLVHFQSKLFLSTMNYGGDAA